MQMYRVNEGRRPLPMRDNDGQRRKVQPGEDFEGPDGLHKQNKFKGWVTPIDADGNPIVTPEDQKPAHVRLQLAEMDLANFDGQHDGMKQELERRVENLRVEVEADQQRHTAEHEAREKTAAEAAGGPQADAEAPGEGQAAPAPAKAPRPPATRDKQVVVADIKHE